MKSRNKKIKNKKRKKKLENFYKFSKQIIRQALVMQGTF